MKRILSAANDLKKNIFIYAIEKNRNALITLNYILSEYFEQIGNKVKIIHEDMRTFQPEEKADIMVSELLGGFGDNELSPELIQACFR